VADFCLYAPCHNSDNRPGPDADVCPIGDVFACVQIDQNNSNTSAGTQEHSKNCTFAGKPAPDAAAPAAAAAGEGTQPPDGTKPPPTAPPPPPPPPPAVVWWQEPTVLGAALAVLVLILIALSRP
jgi:hypothetical protein